MRDSEGLRNSLREHGYSKSFSQEPNFVLEDFDQPKDYSPQQHKDAEDFD